MRVQNEDIHVLAVLAAFNSGRSGVTRGRAHDDYTFAALDQEVIEQAPEQLQSKVLECQGRAVEQLQHPLVGSQLAQGRYCLVLEYGVGFLKNPTKILVADAAFDEWPHNIEGQLVIGQPSPGGDFFLGKAREIFRHIQTTIGSQTSQQNIFKIQGRCLATGAYIAHRCKPSV